MLSQEFSPFKVSTPKFNSPGKKERQKERRFLGNFPSGWPSEGQGLCFFLLKVLCLSAVCKSITNQATKASIFQDNDHSFKCSVILSRTARWLWSHCSVKALWKITCCEILASASWKKLIPQKVRAILLLSVDNKNSITSQFRQILYHLSRGNCKRVLLAF